MTTTSKCILSALVGAVFGGCIALAATTLSPNNAEASALSRLIDQHVEQQRRTNEANR